MAKFDQQFWTIPELSEGFYIEQIQDYITTHISNGVLKPKDLIPPYRRLGQWNKIHRNTVIYVYRKLRQNGWIYSVPGRGTFISEMFPGYEMLYESPKSLGVLPIRLASPQRLSRGSKLRLTNFTSIGFDTPSPHYFPLWHHSKFMNRHVKNYGKFNQMARVIDLHGLEFKDAIHKHLNYTRQFSITPNCMEVIMGREQSLERTFKTLLQPGDQVVNTSPKDATLSSVFQNCDVQSHNLTYFEPDFIEKLTSILNHTKIKALYIRPQCSYPESRHLKPQDCQAIIDLAKKYRFYIVEEDDYHEFWYEPKGFKELVRYDHGAHVIYLGALSLLTSYMEQTRTIVASPQFIALMKMIPLRQFDFRDILQEKVIADLLNTRKIYQYINVMKTEKAKHLVEIWMQMDNYLKLGVKIIKPSSGLSLWLNFSSDVALQEAMDYLVAAQKEIPYHPNGHRPIPGICDIRLGFGSWDVLEAQDAAKLLQVKFMQDYGD